MKITAVAYQNSDLSSLQYPPSKTTVPHRKASVPKALPAHSPAATKRTNAFSRSSCLAAALFLLRLHNKTRAGSAAAAGTRMESSPPPPVSFRLAIVSPILSVRCSHGGTGQCYQACYCSSVLTPSPARR
jgi:hypothetical protein